MDALTRLEQDRNPRQAVLNTECTDKWKILTWVHLLMLCEPKRLSQRQWSEMYQCLGLHLEVAETVKEGGLFISYRKYLNL